MTQQPVPPGRAWPVVGGQASLLLRVVAVAAVIAILIVGFLCLDHITTDRVATGFISAGVLGAILIII
jgi:hypothetical protein